MPFLPKVKLHILDTLYNNGWLLNSVFNKLTCLVTAAYHRWLHDVGRDKTYWAECTTVCYQVIRALTGVSLTSIPYRLQHVTYTCCRKFGVAPGRNSRQCSINYEVWQKSNEINFLLALLPLLQPANTDSVWPSSIPTCSGMFLQFLSVE
jgi:hypothetical protein